MAIAWRGEVDFGTRRTVIDANLDLLFGSTPLPGQEMIAGIEQLPAARTQGWLREQLQEVIVKSNLLSIYRSQTGELG